MSTVSESDTSNCGPCMPENVSHTAVNMDMSGNKLH
jgi:hypothetical protein